MSQRWGDLMNEMEPPRTSPIAVLIALLVGLYGLFGLTYAMGYRMSRPTPDELFPRADFPAEDLVFDLTDIPAVRGRQSAPVDLQAVLRPSSAALAEGARLFDSTCSSCHGPEGRGDGPAGAGLSPLPRDLTRSDGWKNGTRLTDIFRTLTFGIPGSSMSAYDYLSPESRFALAHHVRSLGDFPDDEDTEETVAALDAELGLSRGIQEPSRAPVPAVVQRMAQEQQIRPPLAVPAGWLGTDRERIFRRAIGDASRAAEALAAAGKDWRTNTPALMRLATAGVPANGFSASAASLSQEEWDLLRESLAEISGSSGGS